MQPWLEQPPQRRIEIINQVNAQTGFAVESIEKDWWVTLVLQAMTTTPWIANLVFKGGTSLSKGWNLIARFSEDIDLAMDRSALGFEQAEPNGSQVEKLRRLSAEFTAGPFADDLSHRLNELGAPGEWLRLSVKTGPDNEDPRQIWLEYDSLFVSPETRKDPAYIAPKVIVEIGARSLREPCSNRPITSLVSAAFPTAAFAAPAFDVATVEPQRTVLEKIFLLHEEKTKAADKRRILRMSRHYYDLHQTAGTPHMDKAIGTPELFTTVRDHRHRFNRVPSCQYADLQCRHLDFLPHPDEMPQWEKDYQDMQIYMIGANPPAFAPMMEKLRQLQERIAVLKH